MCYPSHAVDPYGVGESPTSPIRHLPRHMCYSCIPSSIQFFVLWTFEVLWISIGLLTFQREPRDWDLGLVVAGMGLQSELTAGKVEKSCMFGYDASFTDVIAIHSMSDAVYLTTNCTQVALGLLYVAYV